MDGTFGIEFGVFALVSIISIIFAARAIVLLRDPTYANSMIFLNSKKISRLISVLCWGVALPLVFAMLFTVLDLVYHDVMFEYASLAIFVIFFIFMNYVIIRGSLIVGGSK